MFTYFCLLQTILLHSCGKPAILKRLRFLSIKDMEPTAKRLKRKENFENEDHKVNLARTLDNNQQIGSMANISKGYNQNSMASEFLEIERRMCDELKKIRFASPVVYVYNPLEHASEIHENFITKYLSGPKKVMLFGMNPGPWGMSQTGVPFGHVGYVRDWLKLTGNVTKPAKEHPKRPIEGLNCTRSEVSGERLWGLLKELCIEPEKLFTNVFLHNYCPLAFLADSSKNITPPELKADVRQHLQEVCDAAFIDVVILLEVEHLVAVGKYATDRAKAALKNKGLKNIKVSTLMHPSPINPAANKGWKEIALKQLSEAGVLSLFKPD